MLLDHLDGYAAVGGDLCVRQSFNSTQDENSTTLRRHRKHDRFETGEPLRIVYLAIVARLAVVVHGNP